MKTIWILKATFYEYDEYDEVILGASEDKTLMELLLLKAEAQYGEFLDQIKVHEEEGLKIAQTHPGPGADHPSVKWEWVEACQDYLNRRQAHEAQRPKCPEWLGLRWSGYDFHIEPLDVMETLEELPG